MKTFFSNDLPYNENSTYYTLNYRSLQPADIILINGEELQSKVIAKLTQGKFSHAMIMSKEVGMVHATFEGGVFSYNPQRILVKYADNITVLRAKNCNFSAKQIDSLDFFLRDKVGTLYSISEAIKARKATNHSGNDKQFCSRLVAQSYAEMGVQLVKNSDFCTPNDFTRTDILYEHRDLIVKASVSDIAFANSKDKVLLNQIETYKWLEKVREYALKKFNYSIRSQSDVSGFVVSHRDAAKNVVGYISETDYCTMYLMDKDVCPWRYDESVCLECLLKGYITPSHIKYDIKNIEKTRRRHSSQKKEFLKLYILNSDYYHIYLYNFYEEMESFMINGIKSMRSALIKYNQMN